MKTILKTIRIKHYIKNFLIIIPLIFSGEYKDITANLSIILGFFAFSFITSVVYIINDINDIEKDKLHESKKHRPIASGKISIFSAIILACLMFVASFLLNYFASSNPMSYIFLLVYFIMNILYSMHLKSIALIDVSILAIGFVLRVFYGASIIDVEISKWLYLTIISFSFYMGFGKRRNEIIKIGDASTRKSLEKYNLNFLDKNMHMCLSLIVVFYSLWCVDTNILFSHYYHYLIWTVPLVMLILMRYSLIIEKDSHGDPVDVLFSDKMLFGLITIYGIIIITLMLI